MLSSRRKGVAALFDTIVAANRIYIADRRILFETLPVWLKEERKT